MPVSMGDDWYHFASLDHFWIRRRFEVLYRLADRLIRNSSALAEVGCGHGMVQRQIEDCFGREVTGFDLNEVALQQTMSRISPVCCYDIFQRDAESKSRFDVILLFDVLEHLQNEDSFVNAIQFHMAAKGKLLINVPALQSLWSKYDEAAGHFRRYDIDALRSVAERNGMTITAWTYWGLPMLPLLILRKLWLLVHSNENVISTGFNSRGTFLNRALLWLSRCEPIPQKLTGTSLMAVLENRL
jgi:hypothetical protein